MLLNSFLKIIHYRIAHDLLMISLISMKFPDQQN